MLTLAEMAQKAYTGVVTQNGFGATYVGKGAQRVLTSCAYLTKDGMRCNVGHLLTDEKYTPLWNVEGDVSELETEAYDYGIDLPWDTQDEDVDDFLFQLQTIHDGCVWPARYDSKEEAMDAYKAKMKGFCAMHDITLVDP